LRKPAKLNTTAYFGSAAARGFALAFALLVCNSAFAVLGGDISSVQMDQARMKAAINVLPGQRYSVHEMRTSIGVTVREFVSPEGQVFAIAWQGQYSPDLRQLMGEYFAAYAEAALNARRARRVLHIESGDLVFESGGHMRFLAGRAYLRSKLPDGVAADAIH
jgi:hypothetical protein